MNPLESLIQTLLRSASARPNLGQAQPTATFAGRLIHPGADLRQVLSQLPQESPDAEGLGGMATALSSTAPVIGASTGSGAMQGWLERVQKRMAQESLGQHILDTLEHSNTSPQSVVQRFWQNTYGKLPPEVQDRFHQYIKKVTGMSPGSTLSIGPSGQKTTARSWMDVYPHTEAPQLVGHLEGTERGMIALMDEANRRVGEAIPAAQKLLPEK